MYSIEQAVYTSARTKRADGYQVVAHSPGAKDVDLREIAAWAPSHDSLAEARPGEAPSSVNFHPLPSGAFCVSKSSAGGGEFSGRGGERVYSQCLIVPADVLGRFANSPFSVLTAASAQGSIRIYDDLPETLAPIRMGGKSAIADPNAIAAYAKELGPAVLAALVQALIATPQFAIVFDENRQRLMACVLSLLPIECRTLASFSTGLRFSPRRPCRMVGIPSESIEQLKALKRHGTPVLDPRGKIPPEFSARTGWSGFIAAGIAADKIPIVIAQLGKPRPGIGFEQLDALGNALREELVRQPASPSPPPLFTATPSRTESTPPASIPSASISSAAAPLISLPAAAPPEERRLEAPVVVAVEPSESASHRRRSDIGHPSRARDAQSPSRRAIEIDDSPSHAVGWQCPEALDQLEAIDDLVFEGIAGKASAVEKLRSAWPEVLATLGSDLVEESRENYVRHALRVWRECVEGDRIRQPALAISAMEVVCILCNA